MARHREDVGGVCQKEGVMTKEMRWNDEQLAALHEIGYRSTAELVSLGLTFDKEFDFSEILRFLQRCRKQGLDPLLGQAYLKRKVLRYDDGRTETKYVPIISIDAARMLADKTGRYAPGSQPTTYETMGQNLVSATVSVAMYHAASSTWREFSETAYMHEFAQYYWSGGQKKLQRMWESMPRVMLAKVAEMRALRRAFPEALNGLYAEEEWDKEEGRDHRAIEESKKKSEVLVNAAEKKIMKRAGKVASSGPKQ